MTTTPTDRDARNRATIALMALHEGTDLRARDVPRHAWAHLLRVITTPQTPPRRADIQARMDALAADIAKESA